MRLWIIVYISIPYSYGQLRETEYECGKHGRFEYCIDGIPGCVVGCHCHPGYYFDTDTKICEPNIKLTQNFRRNYDYYIEPTRVSPPLTPPTPKEIPTTVSNPVDEKIDIITKDTEDLGDWLYNQFFKTIENQVMNESKVETGIITRRSEDMPVFTPKKPTRRSHKYWKAKRKRKKKKKARKSKLLRITEDDSLFDSSSSSNSDESSSSSDSSDTSSGSYISKEKPHKTHVDTKDHGHKKIVVMNKRPKPPLPSFIFLPNMETPFYPPFGLPQPPMPMYPMVPVPPMMPPYYFQAPNSDDSKTSSVATTTDSNGKGTTAAAVTTAVAPAAVTTATAAPDAVTTAAAAADAVTPATDTTANDEENEPPDENTPANDDANEEDKKQRYLRGKKRGRSRKKVAQKLREKLNRENKLQNYFAQAYQDAESPMDFPLDFNQNNLPDRPKPLPEINMGEEFPGLQDVDFKYLAQLIHKANLNKTREKQLPLIPLQTNSITTKPLLASRRNNFGSYHEQMTLALSDLANNPAKLNSKNPLSYHSFQQPLYNLTNYNIPIQNNYDIPRIPNIQSNNNTLRQFNLNDLRQLTYNARNQLPHNIPNVPANNVPNQPLSNVPNQPLSNVPNQPLSNFPNQPFSNVPNQPTHISLNQPTRIAPYRKKIEDANDNYFANLGRQIASMIRNIDGDKELDIEIKAGPLISNNPILTTNRGSRSYWERSVRSPYMMDSLKEEMNNLKNSNEDLFSLENKVVTATLKESTLTLQELENIISQMQQTKLKFMKQNLFESVLDTTQTSLNVNLLPKPSKTHTGKKLSKRFHHVTLNQSISLGGKSKNSTNMTFGTRKLVMKPPPEPQLGSLLYNFLFTLKDIDEVVNETTPTSIVTDQPTSKPVTMQPKKYFEQKKSNQRFKSYAYTVLPLPLKTPIYNNMQRPNIDATTSRPIRPSNPMEYNHKSFKFYDRQNKNQYLYEKAFIPVKPRFLASSRKKPDMFENYETRLEPSFFHHEIHHFDFFDELS